MRSFSASLLAVATVASVAPLAVLAACSPVDRTTERNAADVKVDEEQASRDRARVAKADGGNWAPATGMDNLNLASDGGR
jgi:hypothetical protein